MSTWKLTYTEFNPEKEFPPRPSPPLLSAAGKNHVNSYKNIVSSIICAMILKNHYNHSTTFLR